MSTKSRRPAVKGSGQTPKKGKGASVKPVSAKKRVKKPARGSEEEENISGEEAPVHVPEDKEAPIPPAPPLPPVAVVLPVGPVSANPPPPEGPLVVPPIAPPVVPLPVELPAAVSLAGSNEPDQQG